MTTKKLMEENTVQVTLVLAILLAFILSACKFGAHMKHDSSIEDVAAFFKSSNKQVLTFIGYSGAEYEDQAAMLAHAARILTDFDPAKTIVNIGATADGIGTDCVEEFSGERNRAG